MRSVEHGGLQAGKPTPNLTCDCRYRFWRRVNIPVAIQACCRRAVGSAAVSCLDQVLVCHNMTIYLLIVTWQVLGCSSVVTNMHPFHRGCAHFARPEGRGASTSSEESCERSPLCIVVVAIQPLTGLSHATTSKCWDRKERCLQATPLAFVPKTTSSEGFMTASIVTEAGILSWKLWASCRRVGFGGMWVASFAYLMWSRK